jgi:hypothetical protein
LLPGLVLAGAASTAVSGGALKREGARVDGASLLRDVFKSDAKVRAKTLGLLFLPINMLFVHSSLVFILF